MDDQFDTQALVTRTQLIAQQIRRSDAYPALIGGIAGGIAGALIAAIVAGQIAARRTDDTPREPTSHKPPWSLRDLAQLATVLAALAKQIQAWQKSTSPTNKS